MGLRQRLADLIGGKDYQNRKDGGVEFSESLWAALQGHVAGSMGWQQAIRVSTVRACARVLQNDLASIPWKIMRNTDAGTKVEAKDHYLWDLVTYAPNTWQTSHEFRSTVAIHMALAGEAFVWVQRSSLRSGTIIALLPLEPNWVQVCRSATHWTELEYRITFPDGTTVVATSNEVWHLRNQSWNSYRGLSALSIARESFGLAKDIEKGQSETHRNVARPSGVLAFDYNMTPEQFEMSRMLIDAQVSTRLSKGLPLVMDKSMTWTQMALKAVDTQTVESRNFQIEDVCAHMGVLPIMIGHADKTSTFASAEQMKLMHFTMSARVWHDNFMRSADRWLLTKKDVKAGYYNHLVDQALLRGDTKARGEFYRMLWMVGAITANEIRELEDMDRRDGLDNTWAPLANAPIGEDGMPMIADGANVDNNLVAAEAAKALGEAFKNSSPAAQARFLAHLSGQIEQVEPSATN